MPLRRDTPLFPQGKTKAFTLSYDDGVVQDRHFIELLKKYGLQATFNLNSGRFDSEEHYSHIRVNHSRVSKSEVKELYGPFEVSGHTTSHPDLARIPMGAAAWEVCEDKKVLEDITGKLVSGFAYPFGTWNPETLKVLEAAGIRYARTVKSTHNFRLPENFLLWDPCCHHDDPQLMELADKFLALDPNSEKNVLPVFYVWGHTYEFDDHKNWDRIESLFQKISGYEEIWYATNGQIEEYVSAVKALRYSSDASRIYNPTAITVWMKVLEQTAVIRPGETICLENYKGN